MAKLPLVDRLAAAMVAIAAHDDDGACTRDALIERGFTPQQIDQLKDQARAKAARLRRRGKSGALLGQPDPARVRQAIDRASRRALSAGAHQPQWSDGFR